MKFSMKDLFTKCDALRDFVPFVQFKKREKHPLRSVDYQSLQLY